MSNRENSARLDWLMAKGFVRDPFMSQSYYADSDALFDLQGLPTYVESIDTDLLVGNSNAPGYYFIFSQPGGGKSSLRKRIHLEYEMLTFSTS